MAIALVRSSKHRHRDINGLTVFCFRYLGNQALDFFQALQICRNRVALARSFGWKFFCDLYTYCEQRLIESFLQTSYISSTYFITHVFRAGTDIDLGACWDKSLKWTLISCHYTGFTVQKRTVAIISPMPREPPVTRITFGRVWVSASAIEWR